MKKKNNPFVRFFQEFMRFMDKAYKDNLPALSGQSAFFLILSAPPLLMFGFTLVSMLTGRDIKSVAVTFISNIQNIEDFPFIDYIVRFIEASLNRSGSGTAIVTAVVTLWSAGNGIYCITEGISRVYELPNKRIWLTKRLFSMLYTMIMLLVVMLYIAFLGVNIIFAAGISKMIGFSELREFLVVLLYIVFGLLQALLMSLALKLFLREKVEDKRYCSLRALMPGMLLTVAAWYVLTFGVTLYIRHFATSSIYGSLGTVFIMMMWIYFLMYILLCGIELNYIYRETFSRKRKKKKSGQDTAASND